MDVIIKQQIDSLQDELKSLLPVTAEQQKRLDEKFALEFNYNSNHIEGNTLTYAETKQFLLFDETGGNHTGREYDEMRASEVALEVIKELAADNERPLTETFIKNLNQVLLVRPYWKEALTPGGQATRRKILIGEYKAQPNSVLLENGKMFEYASPAETPMLMHDLIDWYRSEEEKGDLQPIELAALLHYRFVCIHPFDDGNGRISRLLMNYVLYKNNLPPVIVKTDDKSNYRRALHDADSGNIEAFLNYIAEQLLWSLQFNIKAAKGESLEEGEDWKKKLNVLKKELGGKQSIEFLKSAEVILELINQKLFPLINKVFEHLNGFYEFFLTTGYFLKGINKVYQYPISLEDVQKDLFNSCRTDFYFTDFKKDGFGLFSILSTLDFSFNRHNYDIRVDNIFILTKLYHQDFTRQDIEIISNECGKILLAKIEEQFNSSTNS